MSENNKISGTLEVPGERKFVYEMDLNTWGWVKIHSVDERLRELFATVEKDIPRCVLKFSLISGGAAPETLKQKVRKVMLCHLVQALAPQGLGAQGLLFIDGRKNIFIIGEQLISATWSYGGWTIGIAQDLERAQIIYPLCSQF